MQTGEGSEEIMQAKSEKAEIESSLQHKESAHKSLEMYRSVTDKCKNDWEKIAQIGSKENRTSDEEQT